MRLLPVLISLLTSVCLAGPLEPPLPPASTLPEVEPRIPISSLPFAISASGSYHLTATLTGVSGENGIRVGASNVTIDLNGFALRGVEGTLDAIRVSTIVLPSRELLPIPDRLNICIRNGTVTGWGGDGVNAGNSQNSQFSDLRLSGNGGDGLRAGTSAIITGCSAQENGGARIVAGPQATVSNCAATLNTGDGLSVGDRSTVSNYTAADNEGNGIAAAENCMVAACSVTANGGDGIVVENHCTVTDNHINLNATIAGANIRVTGGLNRIDGNTAVIDGFGTALVVEGANNIITRNTISYGPFSFPYSIVDNNAHAEFITVRSDENFVATNPWANLLF